MLSWQCSAYDAKCHKLRGSGYFIAVGINGVSLRRILHCGQLRRRCVCAGRRSPETPDQRKFVKKFVHELEEMKQTR